MSVSSRSWAGVAQSGNTSLGSRVMNGFPNWLECWALHVVRSLRSGRRPARDAKRLVLQLEPLENRALPSVLGVSPHHTDPHPTPKAEHAARVSPSEPHVTAHAAEGGRSVPGPAREASVRHNFKEVPENRHTAVRESLEK